MARAVKKKRPGRPRAAKGALREVRSVRLPAALWDRMEMIGKPTAVIEKAVRFMLDQVEGRRPGEDATNQPLLPQPPLLMPDITLRPKRK